MTAQFDRPYSNYEIQIERDESFDEPMQIFAIDESGNQVAYDFTHGGEVANPIIEFYVRPTFEHKTLIKMLSTDPAIGGIILEDAEQGMISLVIEAGAVGIQLPPGRWKHFLVEVIGNRRNELIRGDFIVNGGRISAEQPGYLDWLATPAAAMLLDD